MDIYMLLDQTSNKLTVVQTGITAFIQDLVLANSGHVTSTLLPILLLIKIIADARMDPNFVPLF